MSYFDYTAIGRAFIIDFTALYFLAYVILYRKFRNKELFVTCCLFNVSMLVVVMAITRTNFTIAIGFGLFALLSMVQLRSTTFTKAEMGFLFGGVCLAVVNGTGILDVTFVLACNLVIVLCWWAISSWSIEHSADIIDEDNIRRLSLTLDHVDEAGIRDPALMRLKLVKLLNLDVVSFDIKTIDYVKDLMDLEMVYQHSDQPLPPFLAQERTASEISTLPTAPIAVERT